MLLFDRVLQYRYTALGCWMIISTLFNSEIVMVNCDAIEMVGF